MRLTLALTLCSLVAHAGVIFTMETEGEGGLKQMTVSVEGQRLRVDPQGQGFSMVWDGQKKTMLLFDAPQKQYTRLDAATMKRMGDTVGNAMRQMEAQLAKLPPAQREQMREMLKKAMHSQPTQEATKRQPWQWTALGTQKKLNGFTCTSHSGKRGDERMEVCVVPWNKSPVTRDDLKGLTGLADFAKQLTDSMGGGGPTQDLNAEMNEYPGFPIESVRTETDASGKATSRTSRLLKAMRQTVPPVAFAIPAAFTEKPVPTGAMPLE
jgi:hypothetical protein